MSRFESAHSCLQCDKRFLIRDNNEPRPLIRIDSPVSDRYWRLWPSHKEPITLSELKQMTEDGCDFAKYLYEKLTSGERTFSGDTVVDRVPPHMDDTEPNSVVITLSGDNDPDTNVYLTYMAEEETIAAHEVSQRPPNLDPGSSDAFNLAKEWVQDCIQNHSCASPLNSFMPTRIIEISPSGESIQIRQGASPAPYAVLSYCWGGPQRTSLTQSQVQHSHLSFATNTLPQTLKDTVHVCRELGLDYLWVDVLCIIQDDPEDKAIEICRMADIYQNSYVAIMASRAKSVEEGFLHARAPFGAGDHSPGFRLPYECKDGKTGSVILIEESSSQTYVDPLSTRAWAFQEFVLSPRILDYGELRTTWICRVDDQPTDGFSSPPGSCWSRQRFAELALPLPETILEPPHQIWSTLVQCYMGCSLTVLSDRLPALAGIAERFNAITQDEYVAGCWKSYIHLDLMWWQENGRLRKRTSQFFGPSWSWASIPLGEFHYISTRSCCADEGFQVLKHGVEPAYESLQYGSVVSGFLQVRGRILPDQCLSNLESNYNITSFHVMGHCTISLSLSFIPDPAFASLDDTKCPSSALCVCWDEKRQKIWGIVLCEMKSNYFVRTGLFALEKRSDSSSANLPFEEMIKAEGDSFKAWRENLLTHTMDIF